MKTATESYTLYKKLMKLPLEKPITEAKEFKTLAENFPHISESLRLNREMQRLRQMLKAAKERKARLRTKREISRIRAKLNHQKILKQLHGESRQENLLRIHYKLDDLKEGAQSASKKVHRSILKKFINLNTKQKKLVHRNLPPSIFDLKSLYVSEKGLALKEWVQKRQAKRVKP